MSVETYTLDFEIFDTFSWCRWDFDISAGVRYNEFEETLINTGGGGVPPDPFETRRNTFTGWGGIIGLDGIRHLGCSNHALYGRTRVSVMSGEKTVFNVDNGAVTNDEVLRDVVQGQVELGAGYQYSRCWRDLLISFRAGFEWQLWYDYSSAFATVNSETNFGGASNVGFLGFTFGGGVYY